MKPAYEIALSAQELALLGELTAILGQVDDLMVQVVGRLLNIDMQAAVWVMGSSKIADNVKIWSEVIRNRTADEDIIWLKEHACKEIEAVSASRNDFIHAVFSYPWQDMISLVAAKTGFHATFIKNTTKGPLIATPMGPVIMPGSGKLFARRVRGTKRRPVSDLQAVVDQAARLSCLVAHINHLVLRNPATTSTWIERLAPTLPPRLDTIAERKAKALRGRRRPSRK